MPADPRPLATNVAHPLEPVNAGHDGLSLVANVKLVIWDLDDTFWHGTLSEGGVAIVPSTCETVRELNRRGIVSAISSKNDPDHVRATLEAADMWNHFVFPVINWEPKGVQIARLLEDMQLRPENVLFLDDSVSNLREAAHYSPKLQTAGPEIIGNLLEYPQLCGKDDKQLTRLGQYRVLERKMSDRNAASASNERFLRGCDIQVCVDDHCDEHVDRIAELIERTNQLNFTKRRLSRDKIAKLLKEPGRESRVVSVRDRYGDYGICGFYSVRDGELTDFLFSCRILHMGVEQWLYKRLDAPVISIVGDPASRLDIPADVDWISASTFDERPSAPPTTTSCARVLLKGGCDLSLLNDFLHGTLETEFSTVSQQGMQVHPHHTEIVLRSHRETLHDHGTLIDRLPFLDRASYETTLVNQPGTFDVIVYSVLSDYTQGLYRARRHDFVVPYGQHHLDITDSTHWPLTEHMYGTLGVDRAFLEWFRDEFEFLGGITSDAFEANLCRIASLLRPDTSLILMNGAEVPLDNPDEPDRHLRHAEMNAVLQDVVAGLRNVSICDVRSVITASDDLTDCLRHYTRRAYRNLARTLQETVDSNALRVEDREIVLQFRKVRARSHRAIWRLGRRALRRSRVADGK